MSRIVSSQFSYFRAGRSGFTIIELLIVVVIIGVLVTIGLVNYGGIQTRSVNAAKHVELDAWRVQYEAYLAANGTYPLMPDGGYCLGLGFPDTTGDGVGDCRDIYWAPTRYSSNTTLNNALATVGPFPTIGPRIQVNGTLGPYVQYEYSGTSIQLYEVIKGNASDCPKGTTRGWDDGQGNTLLCYFKLR